MNYQAGIASLPAMTLMILLTTFGTFIISKHLKDEEHLKQRSALYLCHRVHTTALQKYVKKMAGFNKVLMILQAKMAASALASNGLSVSTDLKKIKYTRYLQKTFHKYTYLKIKDPKGHCKSIYSIINNGLPYGDGLNLQYDHLGMAKLNQTGGKIQWIHSNKASLLSTTINISGPLVSKAKISTKNLGGWLN